jgi:hypothetical protein
MDNGNKRSRGSYYYRRYLSDKPFYALIELDNFLMNFISCLFISVILNDKSLVDKLDSYWLNLSPRLLKYDGSRTDITKRIRKFYLSEQDYEFVSETPAVTSSSQTSNLAPQVSNGTHQSSNIYPTLNTPLQTQVLPILPSPIPSSGYQEQERTINFEEQFKGFTDLFTDRFYAFPMYQAVRLQSRIAPVYVYYNGYEGQFSLLDVFTGKTKEPAPALKKASNWFKKNILGRPQQAPKHLGKIE